MEEWYKVKRDWMTLVIVKGKFCRAVMRLVMLYRSEYWTSKIQHGQSKGLSEYSACLYCRGYIPFRDLGSSF